MNTQNYIMMKKTLLFLSVIGFLAVSCTGTCDCDVIEDNYTWDGFAWEVSSSNPTETIAMDTCVDAGILDSAISSTGAYLTVTRAVCP